MSWKLAGDTTAGLTSAAVKIIVTAIRFDVRVARIIASCQDDASRLHLARLWSLRVTVGNEF
jgi:hypothetical protein